MKGLYGIADASFGDPVALGRALISGGACAVQVRCKGWPTAEIAAVLRALSGPCRRASIPLIVNDNASLHALCDGVHLGQDDGAFPADCGLRGRSTHSQEQLHAALAEGVDYVGFGPVFGSTTKPEAGSAKGIDRLGEIVRISQVPVVAIGGIRPENLDAVKGSGAQAWAVISAVLGASDVAAVARSMG